MVVGPLLFGLNNMQLLAVVTSTKVSQDGKDVTHFAMPYIDREQRSITWKAQAHCTLICCMGWILVAITVTLNRRLLLRNEAALLQKELL